MSTHPPEVHFDNAEDELEYMMQLIRHIIAECPRRLATTESEQRALELLDAELRRVGLETSTEAFRFNDSLYKNIALHFGLGSLARVAASRAQSLAAALHLLVAASYWADSTRRGYILRRLFRFRTSRNLIATSAASSGEVKLRVVLIAHADAAFTGLLFDPKLVQTVMGAQLPDFLQPLDRFMRVATLSQAALAGVSAFRRISRREHKRMRILEWALALPGLLAFLANLEIVLRDEVVPGACDNLTGCAALPVLANRLLPDQPDDVELVFVVTGAEEASLGGSDALARSRLGRWDPGTTVVLGVDTLSNGSIRFIEREGEISPQTIPTKLRRAMQRAARSDRRFLGVRGFDAMVGATDALSFAYRGYDATTISCIDNELNAPRRYHTPSDTADNIDELQFVETVDFIEAAVRAVVEEYRSV